MSRRIVRHVCVLFMLGLGASCSGALVVDDESKPSGGASEVWSGNTSSCPSAAPDTGAACDGTEGVTCAYRYADATKIGAEIYRECGCWLSQGGGAAWECYRDEDGPPCPPSPPEEGTDCYGMLGQECFYPVLTGCTCNPLGVWSCGRPPLVPASARPADIEPTTPLNELDDKRRQTWCRWYLETVQGPGYPDPIDELDAGGYAVPSLCEGEDWPQCNGEIPLISAADCAANLSLSSCGATVEALDDCVRTFLNGGVPSPLGCAPYLDSPGCSGTIVTAGSPLDAARFDPLFQRGATSEDCSVKVR